MATEEAPSEQPGLFRLRTLIRIRWISILGQIIAVLVVVYGLGYHVPMESVGLVIGASVLVTLVITAERRRRVHLSERDTALYLGSDVLQLAALLFLTGGLENPFAILLMGPPTVGASILDRKSTAGLIGLTVVVITVLTFWHLPVPKLPDNVGPDPRIEAFGTWLALCLAAVAVSAYIFRVVKESRNLARALASTQMALAREQRLSSLGALAAATAHELGTPLGTIALVAGELAEDMPEDSPIAGDIELLVNESRRCRDILANLSRRPEQPPTGAPDERMEIVALVMAIADNYSENGITVDIRREPEDGSPPPVLDRTPALTHGLGNLIHNAMRFARHEVSIRVAWSWTHITLTITDDGPGFAPGLLNKLGEPYLADRSRASGGKPHLGLGIFISKTLLDKQGALLNFSNGTDGGAKVVITWRRSVSQE